MSERHQAPDRTLKVRPYAICSSLHFRLFLEHDRSNRMQGYCIPDELEPVLIPFSQLAVLLQKASCTVRSIDFEALIGAEDYAVRRMTNGKARIMQNRSDHMSFTISRFGMRELVCYDKAEK